MEEWKDIPAYQGKYQDGSTKKIRNTTFKY